jgi:hypothetical protein
MLNHLDDQAEAHWTLVSSLPAAAAARQEVRGPRSAATRMRIGLGLTLVRAGQALASPVTPTDCH